LLTIAKIAFRFSLVHSIYNTQKRLAKTFEIPCTCMDVPEWRQIFHVLVEWSKKFSTILQFLQWLMRYSFMKLAKFDLPPNASSERQFCENYKMVEDFSIQFSFYYYANFVVIKHTIYILYTYMQDVSEWPPKYFADRAN